jgi:S-adenosylmethionine:tRNA ribosyltransferase-isomerase
VHIREFDYELPAELIAQYPIERRDQSRLMVINRKNKTIEHRQFFEITDYFMPGDVLVLNDTKVIPARLIGRKQSGGKVEVFLLRPHENGSVDEKIWHCLINCSKKPKLNSKIFFNQSLTAEIIEEEREGFKVEFSHAGDFEQILNSIGRTPLPPYIKRENGTEDDERLDRERYQTTFARSRGAVAAPTAGLHFTSKLLNRIREKGVDVLFLTLHVGWGTFHPVRVEQIEEHCMHSEHYVLNSSVARVINEARRRRSRIVSVGSTATRSLEFLANGQGAVKPGRGYTNLFIYPGYNFKIIDSLITNFHLPRSTLLMLVAAFAGREFVLEAYREAIKENYRFYSYGDAMIIV